MGCGTTSRRPESRLYSATSGNPFAAHRVSPKHSTFGASAPPTTSSLRIRQGQHRRVGEFRPHPAPLLASRCTKALRRSATRWYSSSVRRAVQPDSGATPRLPASGKAVRREVQSELWASQDSWSRTHTEDVRRSDGSRELRVLRAKSKHGTSAHRSRLYNARDDSAQLAVLAAAAVVAGESRGFLVVLILTG